MPLFDIIPFDREWVPWARDLLRERWGSERVVSRGQVHQADTLPGFLALSEMGPMGLVTYLIENGECEIVTLDSLIEGLGVGSGLIEAVRLTAASAGCRRLWLITTNDNMRALSFYQKRGLIIKAFYPEALKVSRALKPEIPEIGTSGIPLRDEIELEMVL